ncbi:MAG TPA: glycerate kinase [Baekduia sp.]|nr:glycerate kinase [Baekduia sp.]
MTRFLVAPDSFKGTFSASEVAAAIGEGVRDAGAEADLCPVADGGDGTLQALLDALGGESVAAKVHDPLGREIQAAFGLLGAGDTAIVEMAQASGLHLVAPVDRDAEAASTIGTGELIAAAYARGARRIVVTVGGSATTDGGTGAISAIEAAGGIAGATVVCLCDVTTEFERAAEVFAPQKGADAAAVGRLTGRLHGQAEAFPRDPRGVPRTGAAGGLSGALWAYFGAELSSGADWVLDAVGFDERLRQVDGVITGEGRLDRQTFEGKLVGTVAERVHRASIPLHAVVGSSELSSEERDQLSLASITEATDVAQMRAAGSAIATAPLRGS